MDLTDEKKIAGERININQLWWFAAAIPLVTVLTSFLLGGWSWGLMDDLGMVGYPGNVWERTVGWIKDLLISGRFLPTSCFHWAFFYKIFANNPTGFYVFRWAEAVLALGIWGAFAATVVRKKWAAGLFFAVTLGFYEFYEGIFYLSVPELPGILLAAPTVLFFYKAVQPALDHHKPINWRMVLWSVVCLVLAVGTKETFIVLAVALGLSAVFVSFGKSQLNKVLWLGIAFLAAAVFYAVILKTLVVRGYSADYKLMDFSKIWNNAVLWVKKDVFCHSPWILIAVVLMVLRRKWPVIQNRSHFFAVIVSVFLYFGYVLILLPWNAWGHYAIPLGVFFALMVTLLIAEHFQTAPKTVWIIIFVAVILFNALVSGKVLKWHSSYQADTRNLVAWMAQNAIFEHEITNGSVVRGNANEPSATFMMMVEKFYGKKYNRIIFTPNVMEILKDSQTRYYLWGTHWGDQDLRRLGDMWTPVFLSDHWVMFRRMY